VHKKKVCLERMWRLLIVERSCLERESDGEGIVEDGVMPKSCLEVRGVCKAERVTIHSVNLFDCRCCTQGDSVGHVIQD
jgi:hypothetical protein